MAKSKNQEPDSAAMKDANESAAQPADSKRGQTSLDRLRKLLGLSQDVAFESVCLAAAHEIENLRKRNPE